MSTEAKVLEVAERFRAAAESIADDYGAFALLGLFEMEDAPGHWDLVAAAPWIKKGRAGIDAVIDRFSIYFDVKDWQIVSAVVPLEADSELVRAVTRRYHLENEVEEISNIFLDGLYIRHAFLITANPSPIQRVQQPVAA